MDESVIDFGRFVGESLISDDQVIGDKLLVSGEVCFDDRMASPDNRYGVLMGKFGWCVLIFFSKQSVGAVYVQFCDLFRETIERGTDISDLLSEMS